MKWEEALIWNYDAVSGSVNQRIFQRKKLGNVENVEILSEEQRLFNIGNIEAIPLIYLLWTTRLVFKN